MNTHRSVLQVSRIFASSLLSEKLSNNDYLITSDVDLFPLVASFYHLNYTKDILISNYKCCGFFKHNNNSYHMYPMGNIGAKVKTWKELIAIGNKASHLPKTVDDIVLYLRPYFGGLIDKRVIKGEHSQGWSMDQKLVSMLIEGRIQAHNQSSVQFVGRIGYDRLDRSAWTIKYFSHAQDAHVLHNMYNVHVWRKMLPFFQELYRDSHISYRICELYFEEFTKQLQKRRSLENEIENIMPGDQ